MPQLTTQPQRAEDVPVGTIFQLADYPGATYLKVHQPEAVIGGGNLPPRMVMLTTPRSDAVAAPALVVDSTGMEKCIVSNVIGPLEGVR